MTDGTSQGLFIVVAIVIFGIFVVLAYILFEDTLSPTLANMFTNATEQAQSRLDNKTLIAEKNGPYKVEVWKNHNNREVDVIIHGLSHIEDGDLIKFPTWTSNATGKPYPNNRPEQDDIQDKWESTDSAVGIHLGNGTWKYTVKRSEHFNEFGAYRTDIYINNFGTLGDNILTGISYVWE